MDVAALPNFVDTELDKHQVSMSLCFFLFIFMSFSFYCVSYDIKAGFWYVVSTQLILVF